MAVQQAAREAALTGGGATSPSPRQALRKKRRGGVSDAIGALLKVFAMRGGAIPFDGAGLDHKTRTNLKQYVSVLRQRLCALIPGIDGDPVPGKSVGDYAREAGMNYQAAKKRRQRAEAAIRRFEDRNE